LIFRSLKVYTHLGTNRAPPGATGSLNLITGVKSGNLLEFKSMSILKSVKCIVQAVVLTASSVSAQSERKLILAAAEALGGTDRIQCHQNHRN